MGFGPGRWTPTPKDPAISPGNGIPGSGGPQHGVLCQNDTWGSWRRSIAINRTNEGCCWTSHTLIFSSLSLHCSRGLWDGAQRVTLLLLYITDFFVYPPISPFYWFWSPVIQRSDSQMLLVWTWFDEKMRFDLFRKMTLLMWVTTLKISSTSHPLDNNKHKCHIIPLASYK